MKSPVCPTDDVLLEGVRGTLEGDELDRFVAHLDDCEACCERLGQLSESASLDKLVADKRALSTSPPMEMTHLIEKMKSQSFETEALSSAEKEEDLSFLEPSEDPAYIGTLDGYQVRRVAARGGMGLVLEAREPELDRSVAIKVLAPALAASRDARERFMREARAAAALEHVNIMPIYTVKHEKPLPYLVMPFIQGHTLAERIRKGPQLTADEMQAILEKVARALEFAHQRGVIHRDVKPANILLDTAAGRVLLADFGLARVLSEQSDTATGVVSGTPQYMAPEQAIGGTVDARSDLFSLGAVAYHMACGQPPFEGKTIVSLIHQITEKEPVSIAKRNAAVSPWFQSVIGCLLEKAPTDRFQSATELIDSLRQQQAPVSKSLGRPWLIWGMLSVLIVATVFSWRAWNRPARGPFVLNDGQGYQSLGEAAMAASDGDVITIGDNGPWSLTNLALSNKAIAIRALDGFEPVLRYQADRPVIQSSGKLWLEGLTFTHDPESGAPDLGEPVVEMLSGMLVVNNCWFVRAYGQDRFRNLIAGPLIRADHAISVDVRNTFMMARRSTCLASISTHERDIQRVSIKNSILLGNMGLAVSHPSVNAAHVKLSQCLFRSQVVLFGGPNHRRPPLEVDASECIFHFHDRHFSLPGFIRGTAQGKRMLTWRGDRNVYSDRPNYVSTYRGGNTRILRRTFADWCAFAESEEGSRSVPEPSNLPTRDPEFIDRLTLEDIDLSDACEIDGQMMGPVMTFLGPGDSWQRWKETPEAQEWRERTRLTFLKGGRP